jgi:hypothetical protein
MAHFLEEILIEDENLPWRRIAGGGGEMLGNAGVG